MRRTRRCAWASARQGRKALKRFFKDASKDDKDDQKKTERLFIYRHFMCVRNKFLSNKYMRCWMRPLMERLRWGFNKLRDSVRDLGLRASCNHRPGVGGPQVWTPI